MNRGGGKATNHGLYFRLPSLFALICANVGKLYPWLARKRRETAA
jgi:hypothetical protein